MTPINILGPPRTGRKVLTKEQALAEVGSYQDQPDVEIDSKIPQGQRDGFKSFGDTNDHKPTVHPYFVELGRFDVGRVTRTSKDYVFDDLVLPMGYWKKLSINLVSSFDDLEAYKWAQRFQKKSKLFTATGVSPMDLRYGLMTVCYLNQNKKGCRAAIEQLRPCFRSDMDGGATKNSTLIDYETLGSPTVNNGVGWRQCHPFRKDYQANILGRSSSRINATAALSDSSIVDLISNILGENDPERCAKVVEWASGIDHVRLRRFEGACPVLCTTILHTDQLGSELNCTELNEMPKHVRLIWADQKYYSKQ